MRKTFGMMCFVVISAILLCATACNPVKNVSFFVRGTVVGDVDFSAITVFVNGAEKEVTINEDGTFEITNLKKGDVISFYSEGYSADKITIDKVSLTGIIVAFSILTFDISVTYDDALGDVTGTGEYEYGDEVLLTFSAADHCTFNGLTEDGSPVEIQDGLLSFTASEDRNFTADFSKIIYPISFSKNLNDAVASVTESAVFGGTVVLDATDDDNYIFTKWIVNGIEITDKHYEFALSNELTKVSAEFLRRLSKPVLTENGRIVSWTEIENAIGYSVLIDGVPTDKFSGCVLDLTKTGILSGNHKICVTATATEYGNSCTAEIFVQYIRPLDTPKNSGIVRKDGKVYFSFSRVLGAVGYKIEVNGTYRNIEDFDYEEKTNDILVDLTAVIKNAGKYLFRVAAIGNVSAADGLPTALTEYVYAPELSVPMVTIEGDVLTWSHADATVTYDIIVAGIAVKSGVSAGTLNLDDIVEENSAEIIVYAKKAGYADGVYTTTYYK